MSLSILFHFQHAVPGLAFNRLQWIVASVAFLTVSFGVFRWKSRPKESRPPVVGGINNFEHQGLALRDAAAPLRAGIRRFLGRMEPLQPFSIDQAKNGRCPLLIGQMVAIEEQPNGRSYSAHISGLCGKEMVLIAQRAAAPDAIIKVTWMDTQLFCEVRYSIQHGSGPQFRMTVWIHRALYEVTELRRQIESVWQSLGPTKPGQHGLSARRCSDRRAAEVKVRTRGALAADQGEQSRSDFDRLLY
jgi:hypothetical protein